MGESHLQQPLGFTGYVFIKPYSAGLIVEYHSKQMASVAVKDVKSYSPKLKALTTI